MSAIAGLFNKRVNEEQLQAMLDSMRHRGPDKSRTFTLKNATGGAAELSISSRSTQAMSGSDYPVVLFDGDIFNDISGSLSNAEYIREQYIKKGKACFSELDGSFSCAVLDKNEALLVRDHVGARPLIYHSENDSLMFASEAKALLEHSDSVEELPPGHIFSSRDGLEPFNPYQAELLQFDTPEQAAEILENFMVKAVEKRMADGAVKAVALSGGLDSSIIASVAKSIDPAIKLFSTTIKRSPSQDIKYAKIMAEYLGLKHEIYEITDQEIKDLIPEAVWLMETFDEDCISGAVANYYTSKCVSGHTNCVLVGEGADELFGGYFKELKDIADPHEKERVARKLVDIAYNTALRRLDRKPGWPIPCITAHRFWIRLLWL
ncbi:MAG: asparagine synthase-related protein [candidate division KSB1 bacterium]|nr:asparagine synthase-related protein [candidate division KSB1 bacterium]